MKINDRVHQLRVQFNITPEITRRYRAAEHNHLQSVSIDSGINLQKSGYAQRRCIHIVITVPESV